VAMAIGQPIARSSQDLFWLRLTGYWEHCGLRRGADNDDLVRRFVGQVRDNMPEKIVGSRYAAVGTAEDNDFLLGW